MMKHTYTTKHGLVTKTITPMQAIRAKCLDCCCWQSKEVLLCEIENCALWAFRNGENPKAQK